MPIDSIPHGNQLSARFVHFPSIAMTEAMAIHTCDMLPSLHQLPQKLKPKINCGAEQLNKREKI